jgi:hypothetical protein
MRTWHLMVDLRRALRPLIDQPPAEPEPLVYRHVLAPTVEAGAAPMQALRGEPGEGIGSPDGYPRRDDQGRHEADEG